MYNVEPTCQISTINEIYLEHFGYKTDGRFVEVGAFDGQTHSNTCFLADLGWTGLYIEPVDEYLERCFQRHKNNKVWCLGYAVSDTFGVATLKVAGELSTTIENPAELYKAVGLDDLYTGENQHRLEKSLQVTLDCLLNYKDIKPEFDLLVMDTESTELAILKAFNIDFYKPKMVIIEMHEVSPTWAVVESVVSDNKEINKYFADHQYDKIYSDDINTIFVR